MNGGLKDVPFRVWSFINVKKVRVPILITSTV